MEKWAGKEIRLGGGRSKGRIQERAQPPLMQGGEGEPQGKKDASTGILPPGGPLRTPKNMRSLWWLYKKPEALIRRVIR